MKFLEPNLDAIRPAATPGAVDRVDDELATGTPATLLARLHTALGADRVLSRALDLVRYATDASPYRMVPQAVVVAHDVHDISAVLALARREGRTLVFRAGGTSLSGQAQSDDLLVDVRKHWVGVEVLDEGRRVRVKPGTTVNQVNLSLKRHGRVLGPDPASSSVACIGGVVANNSSGMAAGVAHNSYTTVAGLTFVLPSGAIIDTTTPDAEAVFAAAAPELAAGLMTIKADIEADPALANRIRRKYRIKNTNGYRLDSFLDGGTPLDIFRRLVIGSQGTLAFVAEVLFDTVPFGALHHTGLLIFPTLEDGATAVPAFVEAGARAVEMMDANTLKLSAGKPGAPDSWATLPPEACGLLVEFRAGDTGTLAVLAQRAQRVVAKLGLLTPAQFTGDPKQAEFFWRVRESLIAGLGKDRGPETALIVEDVCVPPERIAEACRDVLALQERHEYPRGVAGHAAAGNLHFILALDATSDADRTRYSSFMRELVDLIVHKYDGSLKAEHATGRNMSPFLETEWGAKATELMWRIKELADPGGLLAPGVLLSRDPAANLAHLKTMPTIEGSANACFECGFCEQVCPSRDLTTTPRQRIALRREMFRQPAGSALQRELVEQYAYDAVHTCAGDGTCSIACPVDIDTGALMKQFRAAGHSAREESAALALARHWGRAEQAARLALAAGAGVGDRLMNGVTRVVRSVVSPELVPAWSDRLPGPAPARLPRTNREGAHAVYFPACINRIFGNSRHSTRSGSLPEALVEVSRRAERPLWIPDDVVGACCSTVWHSKGYERGNDYMAREIHDRIWRWTAEGALPLVVDASSCTLGLISGVLPYLDEERQDRHQHLTLVDSVTWASRELAPHLEISRTVDSLAVHVTCSMRHLGLGDDLVDLAARLADDVVVPDTMTCCAFAGDRGLLHPELAASATAREAEQIRAWGPAAHVSANRTCEVGMEQATGAVYESVIFLLEQATRD
ncbi:FAD-binding and (Fe-S)-binding domain-containing protein [Amycolatopsis sp. NPDC005232]|uniref:FAD-binding and (Fe-S)-binding domain-containing protein n=1 Tax=Amycolatopsis sp. NPDC005232 TaxID=3157027 RepID=UPI0033B1CC1D